MSYSRTGAAALLMSPAAAAKRLGLSRGSVYKAIHDGRFAAVRVFGTSGPLRVFTDARGRPLPSPPTSGKSVMTTPSVAAHVLGISARIVVTACRDGRIKAWRFPRGHWRVWVDEATGLPVAIER
jgi:excisionase family DNA binding protein